MANDLTGNRAPEGGALFVVGLYRSGTTLLYALLNQHPQIALMYETDAIAVPVLRPIAKRWPHWLIRNELWNGVLTRHRLELADVLPGKDARALYQAIARRKGARLFGEKAPVYARYLRHVSRLFPGARFIIILRELSETYQSRLDAGSKGSRFFRRRGQLPRMLWSHWRLMSGARQLERAHPVLYIRYREIVDRPDVTATKLCDFLSLEYCEAMESLKAADLSAVYHAPHHDQVRKEVIQRRSEGHNLLTADLLKDLRSFSKAAGQEPNDIQGEVAPLTGLRGLRYFALLSCGCLLCGLDNAKRLLYELLPMSWFQTYRRLRRKR